MLVDEQNIDKNPPGVPGAPYIYESQHIILISSVGDHSPVGLASALKWLAACDRFSGSSPDQ